MKYIDVDLLRKKIAEQMESLPREVGRGAGTITSTGYGMMQAFQIMRSIIDSHQQEQSSEDLEEAAKLYSDNQDASDYPDLFSREDIKSAFIAGAEWQYQKDRGEFAKIKTKTWCEGFDACKEQMMKEAVEGKVFMSFAPGHNQMVMADVDLPTNTKVKIIIVKEEEK